jgi:pimeloyl-ACP methyl ester carboxylesterase
MSRILRALAAFVVLVFVIAGGVYLWKNPERETLDAEARAKAPGRFVQLSDGMTHYDISGPDTGRVVVLVHGFSVPYYIWDSTAAGLSAAGYRVVRYDTYGRGYSDRPDTKYDGELFARQLEELMDSLKVRDPFDLMGLSFGGFVTGHYVAAHPAKVRTLTLVDPVASANALPSLLGWPVVGSWLWQVMRAPGAADGQSSDFLHPERWPDWADRYRPQMRYRGFGRSLRRSAIASSGTDYAAHYAAVGRTGVPTLLIWGKQDSTVSITLSSVVRDNIPGIDYFPVDSSGHLPHMEQASIVRERMLTFLAAHRPSAGSISPARP